MYQAQSKPFCASLVRTSNWLAALACAGCATVLAGNISTDFNSGQPPGTSLYGTAYIDFFGGVGDSGTLKLTDAIGGSEGSFIVDDLDGGAQITGFTARFKLLVGGGSIPPADGFSFNFANDLPNDIFGEEGAGTGLTISFDTYDNGGAEAPAIDLKKGGQIISSVKGLDVLNLFHTGDYVEIYVEAHTDGSLDLNVNGTAVFSGIPSAFKASAGRFGLGARTGGSWDNHWVDDLQITTTSAPPDHPFVLSLAPTGAGAHEDAAVQIVVQDGVARVVPGSIQLKFDGVSVTPTIAKAGNQTTVSYDPAGLMASGSEHQVMLTFSDNGTPSTSKTVSYPFQVRFYLGPTGNIYELIVDGERTWEDANIQAQTRTYRGRPGHLATSTSYEEDLFLNKIRLTSFPFTPGWEVWLGGYQDYGNLPTEGWHWVNNEGPISGVNGGSTYSNWRAGEPNDYFGPDSENYLTLGLNGEFAWNDFGNYGFATRGGYLVEYEALPVRVDIKPDSNPNVVNVQDQGKVPVALLSSADFDATKADVSTIRFGRTGKEAAPVSWSKTDVNKDKKLDLLLTFNVQDTDWRCGDGAGMLVGRDQQGLPFKGSDSVQLNGCPSYALSMTALQDVHQNTDMQLQVSPLLPGYTAPAVAQKVQLKSYKISGQVGWTKNVSNVPLTAGPGSSTVGTLTFPDLVRGQKVLGQANVPNSKSGKIEIIRSDAVVVYRPDLAVQSVVAPESVNTYQRISITAEARELKGDLGAKADAYLIDNGTIIDSISGFLPAAGNAALVFAARLTTPGVHAMSVVIDHVTPGDYDPSNNQFNFTIEAVQPPLVPVSYTLSYYYSDYEVYQEWDNDYSTGVYHYRSAYENFYEYLNLDTAGTFPVANVQLKISTDGVEKVSLSADNIPGYLYDYGGYVIGSASAYLDGNTYFYMESDNFSACCGYQYSYAQVSRYGSQYLYFSSSFYKPDGPQYTDGPYEYNSALLSPSHSIGTRLVIQVPEGKYGGDGGIPEANFSRATYYYPYDREPETGYDRGFTSESYASGYNNGTTDASNP